MSDDDQRAMLAGLVNGDDPGRVPGLTARERALVTYADKLTRAPASVCQEDVTNLRSAGFDDRAIHDTCAVIAYFAFVNRIADGLGVELEGDANAPVD